MRTTIVILTLCALILLALSPVWYPMLTGEDRDVSVAPLDN
jgi:hypothetical protein